MNDDIVNTVAGCIVRYLHAHPHAADTVEGVHHVWVDGPAQAVSIDITQAALDYLLANGKVACVRVAHRLLWRLPADRNP